MKALVVGYGSIGSRHTRLLKDIGCETAVVSSREIDVPGRYPSIAVALDSAGPEYVVIANETNRHFETVAELAGLGFDGLVLVEKPLFHTYMHLPGHKFKQLLVAYNLRFHRIIEKLYSVIKSEKILTAQAYVGQYLPDWRPSVDYKRSYSASAAEGGGVLRDLSHELDLLNWLLGGWVRLTAIGGHYSKLEITSDDVFAVLMVAQKCPIVTLQMNYMERRTRRVININTDSCSIEADLVGCTLSIDGKLEKIEMEKDHTYRTMHQAVLNGEFGRLCSVDEAMDVMHMIQAAEESAKHQVWMSR